MIYNDSCVAVGLQQDPAQPGMGEAANRAMRRQSFSTIKQDGFQSILASPE
jgi:hypothetical protein